MELSTFQNVDESLKAGRNNWVQRVIIGGGVGRGGERRGIISTLTFKVYISYTGEDFCQGGGDFKSSTEEDSSCSGTLRQAVLAYLLYAKDEEGVAHPDERSFGDDGFDISIVGRDEHSIQITEEGATKGLVADVCDCKLYGMIRTSER